MKHRLVIFILTFLTAIGFCVILSSCGNGNSATIEQIDGASINGSEIFMYVDSTTDEVSLSDKVKCSNKSVWKLYYDRLGQTEIPTKIATGKNGRLQDGNNIFYIVVNSQDGTNTNTYQLTIHRSYAVNVYYHSEDSILKTERVYTGVEYSINYEPNLTGYIFNGWATSSGESISKLTPWESTHIYADTTPLNFEATLDVNGGDTLVTTNISLTYGKSATLPVPTKTGYSFLGWYIDNIALTDNSGKTLPTWNVSMSSVITARWEILHLTVTISRSELEAGTVTGSGTYDYGTDITLVSATNKGYNFIGWFDKNDNIISENATYSFKVIEDISVFAKWNYFTLTSYSSHNASGNATTFSNEKISVGEEITLTATDYNNIGYIWKGWYSDDEEITKELSFTYTMQNANITFLAKWEVYDELINFAFDSTNTSCKITGVIDKSIEELSIPIYVTAISKGALKGCTNLIKISLPFTGATNEALEASELTLFGYIFGSENFSGSIKTIQYYKKYNSATYYIPESLKEVSIESGNIFYGAFYNCSMLTDITFGENITLIDDSALNGCGELTKITLPFIGKTNSSNKSRESLFGYIFGTNKYDGSTSVRQWYDSTSDKTETYYVPTSLTKVIITTAQRIPYGAFSYCTTIKEIVLPDSVKNIGDSAFTYTTSLKTVYWNAETVADLNFSSPIFMGSNVETIILDSAVQTIPPNAFNSCHKLENVIISSDSKLKSIGENAFIYCYALSEIYLPKSINEIGWRAFFACTILQTVKYAGSANEWTNINIGPENEPLTNATIIFNSSI